MFVVVKVVRFFTTRNSLWKVLRKVPVKVRITDNNYLAECDKLAIFFLQQLIAIFETVNFQWCIEKYPTMNTLDIHPSLEFVRKCSFYYISQCIIENWRFQKSQLIAEGRKLPLCHTLSVHIIIYIFFCPFFLKTCLWFYKHLYNRGIVIVFWSEKRMFN